MATENQKAVFKRVHNRVIKGEKVSISKEMRGIYGKSFSNQPSRLTESDGWKELMDKYLPDKTLAKVHKEGLGAIKKEHKIVDRDDDGKPIYDFVDVDDYATRHKYLDTAYKLKGSYAPEKKANINLNVEINNKESQTLIDEYEEKLRKLNETPQNI